MLGDIPMLTWGFVRSYEAYVRARFTAGILLCCWSETRGFVGFCLSEDRAARKNGAIVRIEDAILEPGSLTTQAKRREGAERRDQDEWNSSWGRRRWLLENLADPKISQHPKLERTGPMEGPMEVGVG